MKTIKKTKPLLHPYKILGNKPWALENNDKNEKRLRWKKELAKKQAELYGGKKTLLMKSEKLFQKGQEIITKMRH